MHETIIIPIQLDTYEAAFNPLDRRPLDKRKINDEVDTFIKENLFKYDFNPLPQLQLDIYMPHDIYDSEKEQLVRVGLLENYHAYSAYAAKIKKIGSRRLIYYITSSLLLGILYYYVEAMYGVSFFSTILSTASTVILWQASSLVFIESKNFKINVTLHKILTHLTINFIYES